MKLRNLANKLFFFVFLAILCCGQVCVNVVSSFTLLPQGETVTAKSDYYFDKYNYNKPTEQSLYQELGITVYNDYLTALAATQNLRDVVVAVVDSGLDDTHPVFEGRVLSEYAVSFAEGIGYEESLGKWHEDHNGHGTHVAGIIADMTLNNVKILPVKIFSGLNNATDNYAFENAVRYLCALKKGRQVKGLLNSSGKEVSFASLGLSIKKLNIIAVNMSLGTDGYDRANEDDMLEYNKDKYGEMQGVIRTSGFQDVIDDLTACEILPIAAAGNTGTNESSRRSYYSLPAACDGVLSVSAYNTVVDSYELADFSYHNDYVSIAAPGTQIWSACSQELVDYFGKLNKRNCKDNNGNYIEYSYGSGESKKVFYARQDLSGAWYFRISGTSMATPYVTACYAMLCSDTSKTTMEDYGLTSWNVEDNDQYLMNWQHKALLAAGATYADKGDAGYDEYFGYGVVNVGKFAVDTVLPLNDIHYELAVENDPRPVKRNETDEIDWFMLCCVLGVGSFLVWLLGRIKSYFIGRKA